MTLTQLIVNIVADLCPHGMLPLAYGLSQGGPTGLIPSIALMAFFGAASSYTMSLYAKLAVSTGSKNIGDVWAKLMSPKSRWVVDASLLALCAGCCIFYSAFIGDIFAAVASALSFGGTGVASKRWAILVAMTSAVLLPLCLLEDLSALQFSSLFGVAGIIYTVLFHFKRVTDGTYAATQSSNTFNLWGMNAGTLVLGNMLCVAFLAHYNAINYYQELEGATADKFNFAIRVGYRTAFAVFASMMLVGYKLFGSKAQPLILNNFPSSGDDLATLARVATGLAITFAYPLMFAGVKASLKSLLARPVPVDKAAKGKAPAQETATDPALLKAATVAVLAAITAVAIKCGEEDVSVVLGLVGSVIGCSVAYVLPAVLALKDMRLRKRAGLANSGKDVLLCHGLIPMGVVFGVLGVWITLKDLGNNKHH